MATAQQDGPVRVTAVVVPTIVATEAERRRLPKAKRVLAMTRAQWLRHAAHINARATKGDFVPVALDHKIQTFGVKGRVCRASLVDGKGVVDMEVDSNTTPGFLLRMQTSPLEVSLHSEVHSGETFEVSLVHRGARAGSHILQVDGREYNPRARVQEYNSDPAPISTAAIAASFASFKRKTMSSSSQMPVDPQAGQKREAADPPQEQPEQQAPAKRARPSPSDEGFVAGYTQDALQKATGAIMESLPPEQRDEADKLLAALVQQNVALQNANREHEAEKKAAADRAHQEQVKKMTEMAALLLRATQELSEQEIPDEQAQAVINAAQQNPEAFGALECVAAASARAADVKLRVQQQQNERSATQQAIHNARLQAVAQQNQLPSEAVVRRAVSDHAEMPPPQPQREVLACSYKPRTTTSFAQQQQQQSAAASSAPATFNDRAASRLLAAMGALPGQ